MKQELDNTKSRPLKCDNQTKGWTASKQALLLAALTVVASARIGAAADITTTIPLDE